MLKNEQAVSAEASRPEPEFVTAGPIHYTFGGGPTSSWWGLLGWWGLFRSGRDARLAAFGRTQAKGFGDWVDAYADAGVRHKVCATRSSSGSDNLGDEQDADL